MLAKMDAYGRKFTHRLAFSTDKKKLMETQGLKN